MITHRTGSHPSQSSFRCIIAAALLMLGALCGCDDRSSDVPPPPPPNKPLTPEVIRPTTQQILSAPRKPIQLLTFPLTMDVPDVPKADSHSPEWRIPPAIATDGSTLSIEGPSPAGDVVIQLVPLPGEHPNAAMDAAERAARKELAANPTTVLMVDVRNLGPVHLIERRAVQHLPETVIEVDKPGSLTGELEHRRVPATDFMDWSLQVFYPISKDKYGEGTLTFSGLTKDQYDKDKTFLEQLITSLRYEAPRGDLP
jgi:hypothetical protein